MEALEKLGKALRGPVSDIVYCVLALGIVLVFAHNLAVPSWDAVKALASSANAEAASHGSLYLGALGALWLLPKGSSAPKAE